MEYKKKLIEVALPLEAINRESAREKSIRHGHPSTLHLWWSRKPLATARAVLFASLVDDPSSHPEKFPTEKEQNMERKRLFGIVEELVKFENSNNEDVLRIAKEEILKSTNGNLPNFLDPFCGGGSIPLEAQRLGLEAKASDLNPVAVMITKALIEIPPKFANMPPVNPDSKINFDFSTQWKGVSGLAKDVEYYGKMLKKLAEEEIGHLYPKVTLPIEYGGGQATVIAWIWCRSVKCPNPACGVETPLTSKFWLSNKRGTKAWVEPMVKNNKIEFIVKTGNGHAPEGTVNRRGAKCICCETPITFEYIRSEGKLKRLGKRLIGIVAEGSRGRYYLSPDKVHETIADIPVPNDIPDTSLPEQALSFRVQLYGMTKHSDLFTNRQITALTTFSDLIRNRIFHKVYKDALNSGLSDDDIGTNKNTVNAKAYAVAISTYLAFIVDQLANHQSLLCSWNSTNSQMRSVFARQALPMIWDFAESNPFCDSSGSFNSLFERMVKGFSAIPANVKGVATQADAMSYKPNSKKLIISTDPPYYDNIGYADLSDYFYIWLRRTLKKFYPDLLSTMLVPKAEELVATPYRFDGSKDKAQAFFEEGLYKVFKNMISLCDINFPVTIYYAFKQTETDINEDEGEEETVTISSTGWETMLEGLVKSGFEIVGTWPIRTEKAGRSVGIGTNALASSIVLVCRVRSNNSGIATRRELLNSLKKELPHSLKKLQQGNIAPVDLAQAAIGPGMSVFSRYSKVLDADGTPMSVRTALQIINQELDAYLASQEGEMDSDTRFCVAWYEQFGMNEAAFGEADVLARAKNTAVDRLVDDGVLSASKGKVRLLKRDELEDNWDPVVYKKDMIWMHTQQLVKTLEAEGEGKTAALVTKMRNDASERAKELAYRLYTIAERKGLTEEALAYNSLVVAWPDIQKKAAELSTRPYEQMDLF